MGIATSETKNYFVSITDNDNIAESNLNRQFLFRPKDIGKSKSEIACANISKLNKNFNCKYFQSKVCKETENIFNQNFWEKQNFIINAVDNVEARVYNAKKCEEFKKILIDSGTNGNRANSQIIIPNETVSYSDKSLIKDESIPMGIIRNYPTSINHCIEWALDIFNKYFVGFINKLKLFIEDKETFFQELSKQGLYSE